MNKKQKIIARPMCEERLQEIVQRIVRVAHPEKIILFGSHAKGNPNPDSDVDLLVIAANADRGALTEDIYESLIGVGMPVDVLVARPEDLEQYGSCPATVFYPALRDGYSIYAA